MSTCNRLDLQTLGSQPVIMPKILPEHWARPSPRPKPEMLSPPPQNLRRLLTSQVRHIEGKAFQVGIG